MIRPADDKPLKGGLGGGAKPAPPPVPTVAQIDPRTPGKDLRLIQQALHNGWEIRPEALKRIPDEMIRLVITSEDDRARVNAAKVLVAMMAQNKPTQPTTQVNVQVNADLYD